jgi:hypothetical protein
VWYFITLKSCVTTDDGLIEAETRMALTEYCDKSKLENKYSVKNNLTEGNIFFKIMPKLQYLAET